jgi:hypothetical protein
MMELISSERPRKSLGMVRRSCVESRVMLTLAEDWAESGGARANAAVRVARRRQYRLKEAGRGLILCIEAPELNLFEVRTLPALELREEARTASGSILRIKTSVCLDKFYF